MTEHRAAQYRSEPQDRCNMCGSGRSKVVGLRLNGRQGLRPRGVSGIAVSVRKCLDCELVYADPLPVPQNVGDHYDMDPEVYFADGDPEFEPANDPAIVRLTGFRPGMKALDIGAGTGRTMKILASQGWDAWGIEPSASFARFATERNGIPADRIQLSTIEAAKFEPQSFDFINFGAVLEHLYSPSEALGRAVIWLKPGGIIYVEVPSSRYLITRLLNLYYRETGVNYVANISPMHAPFHLFEFSLKSFEANGRRNGYRIAEHLYWPGDNTLIPRPVRALFRRLMAATGTGMQLSVYLRPAG
jgi:2-polyprenyl-3-methyl-5-hydroxy-6-metoxy-1,4-benzoquinol methylase